MLFLRQICLTGCLKSIEASFRSLFFYMILAKALERFTDLMYNTIGEINEK